MNLAPHASTQAYSQVLQARKAGRYYESNRLLLAVDAMHMARKQLEFATNHYHNRNYAKSLSLLRQVLSTAELPDSVRKKALVFLQKVKYSAHTSRIYQHRWAGQIRLGAGSDDNANTGSSDEVISDLQDGGGLLFLDPSNQAIRDDYHNYQLALRHRYTRPSSFDLWGSPVVFKWRNNIKLNGRNYARFDRADQRSLQLKTGAEWLNPQHWQSQFSLKRSTIELHGQPYLHSVGGLLEHKVWLQPNWYWGGRLEHADREYQSLAETRDGRRLHTGLYSQFSWGGKYHLHGTLGFIRQDAPVMENKYQIQRSAIKLLRSWRNKSYLALQYTHDQYHYSGIDAGYLDSRQDDRLNGSLLGSWQLRKNMQLSARYSHTRAHSNHALHEYTRRRFEGSVTLQF